MHFCAHQFICLLMLVPLLPVEMVRRTIIKKDGNKYLWWKPGMWLVINFYRNIFVTVESNS